MGGSFHTSPPRSTQAPPDSIAEEGARRMYEEEQAELEREREEKQRKRHQDVLN
ncbi:hypothetical protein Tco_0607289, partial [Tanacetum coccineum]